jgi:hypothetical protein
MFGLAKYSAATKAVTTGTLCVAVIPLFFSISVMAFPLPQTGGKIGLGDDSLISLQKYLLLTVLISPLLFQYP